MLINEFDLGEIGNLEVKKEPNKFYWNTLKKGFSKELKKVIYEIEYNIDDKIKTILILNKIRHKKGLYEITPNLSIQIR